MLLWDLCFPNRKLSNRISNDWKEIGFQGTNPATDFRFKIFFLKTFKQRSRSFWIMEYIILCNKIQQEIYRIIQKIIN